MTAGPEIEAPGENGVRVLTVLGFLAAALVVMGAFLPWIVATNDSGTTTAAGIETILVNVSAGTVRGEQRFRSDGFLFVIEAAVCAALLALTFLGFKRILFSSMAALVAALVVAYAILGVLQDSQILSDMRAAGTATGRIGDGLWLIVIGSATLELTIMGALVTTIIQRRRSRPEADPESEGPGPSGGEDAAPHVPIGGTSG